MWTAFGAADARADQDAEASFRTFPTSIQWTEELPSGTVAPPVRVNDVVIVSLISGSVRAMDVSTRKNVWTAKLAATAPLAASDDTVLVAAEDGLYALAAADGRTKWKSDIAPVKVRPVVAGGWAIVVAGAELTALRAADGPVVWTRSLAPVSIPGAVDGHVLYQPFDDGRIVALDLASGSPLWERQLGAIETSPLVYRGRLYVGASKQLFCLNAEDGQIAWAQRIGAALVGWIAADDERVYTASMDNLLRAFHRTNGAREWPRDLGYRPTGGPILTGRSITAPGRTTALRAFNVSKGTPVAQLMLPIQAATSPVIIPPDESRPGRLAIIANEVGKPWLLVLAAEAPPPPPELPLTPLSVLPGTSLPIPKIG